MAEPLQPFASRGDWAAAAADRLAAGLREGLVETGSATLAGAGGSTPSPIYRRLSSAELDWSRVTVTLVDERHVPETSPQSNAALIRRDLLTGRAASASFMPLHGEAPTVDRAALAATRVLAEHRLDAVLLGMGEDGHICSMFPGSPTLATLLKLDLAPAIVGVPPGRDSAAPPQERLSMNLPWLAQARCLVLAIGGAAKRAVFEREATGDPASRPIAALIASGAPLEVYWTEAV